MSISPTSREVGKASIMTTIALSRRVSCKISMLEVKFQTFEVVSREP